MGFFAKTGKFSTGGEFEVAEAGTYTCRLKEVVEEKGTKFDDPSVEIDQYKWTFEATEAEDSKGEPYRFIRFTGIAYGNDKANLTKMLDGMLGRRLTQDEYEDLDIDDLKGRKWKVMVDEITNQKGNQVNKILSVKPAVKTTLADAAREKAGVGTGRPKPKVEDDDPFAE